MWVQRDWPGLKGPKNGLPKWSSKNWWVCACVPGGFLQGDTAVSMRGRAGSSGHKCSNPSRNLCRSPELWESCSSFLVLLPWGFLELCSLAEDLEHFSFLEFLGIAAGSITRTWMQERTSHLSTAGFLQDCGCPARAWM